MSLPEPVSMSRRMLLGAGALAGTLVAAPGITAVARQKHAERIEALIREMTIEEKAGQLTLLNDPFRWSADGVNPEDADVGAAMTAAMIRAGRVGALFNGIGATQARSVQDLAVRESRLGIPLLFAADIVHGLRTIFPVPLGEAASWDPELAERTARAAAAEGGAMGIHQTYAPMVDIGRDQRWGRVVEGAGEDVLLGCLFAAARVRGFQGADLSDPASLLATPKHFAAYGAAEAGLDYNGADMSEQTLRSVYLPPFQAALDAGAQSVMSAFNDLNGVPATGNRWLLTEILREEWEFAGFVVSDYEADRELVAHGIAANDLDAARIALMAGVDMSMKSGIYLAHLPDLVATGNVPVARVDEAVRRVLLAKAALGLFDDPYRGTDPAQERRVVGSSAHRDLAREAGRRSIVLLKNDRDLLPLPKARRRIALIGPFGADRTNVFGPWSIFADHRRAVSIEDGLRAALPASSLTVVKGCDAELAVEGGISAAVAAAQGADLVVLALGESAGMSAEAQSRVEIVVPSPQQALAEAVATVGRPTVVLLKTGRALALSGAVAAAEAILVTWFLGSEEGHAIADVLFGDHAPEGRLPVSFPHASGQQPYYYGHKMTGRPERPGQPAFKTRFREVPNSALYPFGHGLGYAALHYGRIELSSDVLAWDGELVVRGQVANRGPGTATEVVQLYVRDRVASLTQPGRILKAFHRVTIAPGETIEVAFTLRRGDLSFIGRDLEPTVEPGAFDLWLAPHAQGGLHATFTLTR